MINYYCKNEKDLKKVAIDILKHFNNEFGDDNFLVCSCDYCKDKNCCDDTYCYDCREEECLLLQHLFDKDVCDHIETYDFYLDIGVNMDKEYPYIICVNEDAVSISDFISVATIEEAKENTKYGIAEC